MCLGQDLYRKKLWGGLDELCAVLADAPLPQQYQPITSAQISINERFGHAGEFSLLLEEHVGRVVAAAGEGPDKSRQVSGELAQAADHFQHLARHFEQAANVALELADKVEQINYTQRTSRVTRA